MIAPRKLFLAFSLASVEKNNPSDVMQQIRQSILNGNSYKIFNSPSPV